MAASSPESHPALVQALADGATILTGNQRAARTLRRQIGLHHQAEGRESWQPPPLFAWESWTAALWQRLLVEGRASALLLNPAQEHALWRAIIAADPAWSGLAHPDTLAEMAADAWSRLATHRGEARLRDPGPSTDTRAFARWAHTFAERCRHDDLLPQAQLESRLAPLLTADTAPTSLLLTGFDTLTPARHHLLATLTRLGATVTELPPSTAATQPTLVAAPSEDDELQAAARWLRLQLATKPAARLALIVPGMDSRRAELDRVLRHTFPVQPDAFEFSLGTPLARTPSVAVALDLLRWPLAPLSLARVSRLLLTLGDPAELAPRAQFDAEVRRQRTLRPELTLDRLLRLAETSRRAPRLLALLASLRGFRRAASPEELAGSRSHAHWAETIRSLVSAARWNDADDSLAFQLRQRWESLLDHLATLDFTGLRVSFPDALAAVERLAQQTLFAPESRDAPLQVMGPLESAGSTFDAVWFLGAGDLTWPQRPATTPLLPWHLQRELGMPGADADADTTHAQRVAERLAQSAPIVIFSYADEIPDARQRPSPALTNLHLQADLLLPVPPRKPVTLDTLDDTDPLPALPDTPLRGGARVLQLQAACAFRAFAEQRLHAAPLEARAPRIGMDPRDSGSAIHRALEHFFTQIRSQDELRTLPPIVRLALLSDAIEAALSPVVSANSGPWDAAFLDLQCERLLSLLDAWLRMEMTRKVPFQVKEREVELKDVHIGALRLSLRVDRVDQTEFGEVILDYKTGESNPRDWLGDRPDAPQLPLYAVLSSDRPDAPPLAGVAFAQVRTGELMGLHGYQIADELLLKGARLATPTLEDQVAAWRSVLVSLAVDFHRGDARVRPKHYPTTCMYCGQRPLCRLDVSLLDLAGEDVEQESTPAGDDHG